MKRLPIVLSFVLFLGLCATVAYWVMEFTKPPLRPIAPPPRVAQSDIGLPAAAGLFGGRNAVAVASNYQLKGIVVAGNPTESVAILAADAKPARAVRVGAEIMPGTTVKEVAARYVLLSEGGVIKRVELPDPSTQVASNNANTPPSANLQMQRQMEQQRMQMQQQMERQQQQMQEQMQQMQPPPTQQMRGQQGRQQLPMATSPAGAVTQQMPESPQDGQMGGNPQEGQIPPQEESGAVPEGFPPQGDLPPNEAVDPAMQPGTQ